VARKVKVAGGNAESGGLAFGLIGLREWRDDELVVVFIYHEFEPAGVAAIHDARQRAVLLVLKVNATGRTRPRHGRQAARTRRVRW
jgi:hypothetical protein